jgi:hypothetical protein
VARRYMGGWCPRAPSSHVVAAPPSSAMNAGHLMLTTQLPPYAHVTAPPRRLVGNDNFTITNAVTGASIAATTPTAAGHRIGFRANYSYWRWPHASSGQSWMLFL